MGKQLIDLTGKRFGRLVVIERDGTLRNTSNARPTWRCRCDCGNECIITGHALRQGLTKSCGCLRTEALRARRSGKEGGDG